jgi:hypothetical protein
VIQVKKQRTEKTDPNTTFIKRDFTGGLPVISGLIPSDHGANLERSN